MILLDFLSAADGTPLTKTFEKSPLGGYDVTPYPFNRLFTSTRVEIQSTEDLYASLVVHSSVGNCLLKGNLSAQLREESRQGMTDPAAATRWLCLDLDFQEGWDGINEFLATLDPGLADVSYVFQHSASAGIKYEQGLRGHVFILLERPLLPTTVKLWLKSRNLQISQLKNQLDMAANGASLKWPLDITTCQNDKLIYIAPPQCVGFDDPLEGQRFTLVTRGKDKVTQLYTLTSLVPATIERDTQTALADLRTAAGLEQLRPRYREARGIEYLANPDGVVVTGVKQARGYVYLNLNHGDSWAYYFPEDNPEFLFNFKGEPTVRLKDVAPDFFREYRAQTLRKARTDRDFTPLVFRDRIRDIYYNVLKYFDGRVDYSKCGSLQKLNHFMLQYGEAPPEIIPDWEVTFDPTQLNIIDEDRRWLNTFQPTPYLLNARGDSQVGIPPVIYKVIHSVCGNDQACVDHFLNWLAYIFQTRKKTGTGWIFHGVHGTGKGVLHAKIMKPLFGSAHVLEITGQLVEDQFNGALEQAILVTLDEFHHESARSSGTVMNKLKNLITEDDIAIRAMRQDTIMVRNFCNLMICTNHPDPVVLATTDRRFNVPPAQETPLRMSEGEINSIADELPLFADFLMSRVVHENDVRKIIMTEARTRMIAASQTSVERFFDNLRQGDLGFFAGFIATQMPMQDQVQYIEFDTVVRKWVSDFEKTQDSPVSINDMRSVYQYIIGAPTAPAKLKRMLDVYRIPYAERPAPTVMTKWAMEPEQLTAYHQQRAERLSGSTHASVSSIRAA
jgi:hypothetical protein